MNASDRDKWNRIYQNHGDCRPNPARVLAEHAYLLPDHGVAVDIACGTGGNAILLAEHGLETHAWDISDAAVKQLQEYTGNLLTNLIVQQRDVISSPPDPDTCDVIVVTRFLDRSLIPHIIKGLRNNGLVFYQTFIKDKPDEVGPRNPEYLLDKNELLRFFISLQILFYREEGSTGDNSKGFRNEAMLIARKKK